MDIPIGDRRKVGVGPARTEGIDLVHCAETGLPLFVLEVCGKMFPGQGRRGPYRPDRRKRFY